MLRVPILPSRPLPLSLSQAEQQQLAAKEASLPAEPPASDRSSVQLMVRLPDGTRLSRRFCKTDSVQVRGEGRGEKTGGGVGEIMEGVMDRFVDGGGGKAIGKEKGTGERLEVGFGGEERERERERERGREMKEVLPPERLAVEHDCEV